MTERTLNGRPIVVGEPPVPVAPPRPAAPTWTHVAIVGETLLFAWGVLWVLCGK